MSNPRFSSGVPERYYEMALSEAAPLLSGTSDGLVSLKIRPIQKWPIEADTEFANAYVYPDEYAQILAAASANLTGLGEGAVSRGKAHRFEAVNGEQLLLVEHETGPELIAYLALAAASASLLKEVVSLAVEIVKAVNSKNEAKKRGKGSQNRYYQASAIAFEERTATGSRLLRVVTLPVTEDTALETTVREVLRQLRTD